MKVLYDTDFLLSYLVTNEPNSKRAIQLVQATDHEEITILMLVQYELATVMSRKFDQKFALDVLTDLTSLPIDFIELTEDDEEEVWKEFYSHKKKNISFVDCANLVIARKYGMKIASFDSFYPSGILLK